MTEDNEVSPGKGPFTDEEISENFADVKYSFKEKNERQRRINK